MRARLATLSSCLLLGLAGPVAAQSNVLLIVADDLGVDRVACYGEVPDPGTTPVIDALAAEGLLFRNCWSHPTCSPTRATLLTGRHAGHTGMGKAFSFSHSTIGLSHDEVTLAEVLGATHATWAVGKWHLSTQAGGGSLDPLTQGFDRHLGPMENLPGNEFGNGYFAYTKSVDGTPSASTTYATTEQVDDALALIQGASGPWFLYLAFNAPHTPLHAPPAALHGFDLPADLASDKPLVMKAMVEAMDTEIGRLLAGIPTPVLEDTLIVFVGDNGTAHLATSAPFLPEHAKGTLYEGGVRVPLILRGPGVQAGAECRAPVSTSDLFATIAETLGASQTTGLDSVSLVPYFAAPGQPSLRTAIYAENFLPNGPGPYLQRDRAARDERFKLIARYGAATTAWDEEFYDLVSDPFETQDLSDTPLTGPALASYQALHAVLDAEETLVPWATLGHGLAGTLGEPLLVGAGLAEPDNTVGLMLTNVPLFTGAGVILGLDDISLPFKGGVLVPSPDVLLSATTGDVGFVQIQGAWPAGVPGGIPLYLQGWVIDPGGPAGVAASEGLTVTSGP